MQAQRSWPYCSHFASRLYPLVVQWTGIGPIRCGLKMSHCSVSRMGEDWLATSWPRRGSIYSDFVYGWLLKLISVLHKYNSIYTEFLGRWSGWSLSLVTSNLNIWFSVNGVMPYFLIWSQRFQLSINCIFLTFSFETGLCRNVSQDNNIPFATPVNYYSRLVWHHFLTHLIKSLNSMH